MVIPATHLNVKMKELIHFKMDVITILDLLSAEFVVFWLLH